MTELSWQTPGFIEAVVSREGLKGNQFGTALNPLLKQSPYLVADSDLRQEAIPKAQGDATSALNDLFRDLRQRIKQANLDGSIGVYRLRTFASSIALPPLKEGSEILLQDRQVMIASLNSSVARGVATELYPVKVVGWQLYSRLEFASFYLVHQLLQNPEGMRVSDLVSAGLIEDNANLGYLKDQIDVQLDEMSSFARLYRDGDRLKISFEPKY